MLLTGDKRAGVVGGALGRAGEYRAAKLNEADGGEGKPVTEAEGTFAGAAAEVVDSVRGDGGVQGHCLAGFAVGEAADVGVEADADPVDGEFGYGRDGKRGQVR